MDQIKRILFVCMDNTCRSIMAEEVMRSVCRDRKLEIASRGLIVLFPEPLNPKAVAVLTGNQMAPQKECSEGLQESDITEGTLILTMTEKEAQMVKESFPMAENVVSLGAFIGKPGDITEPHGGSLADYGACYEYIDLMVKLAAESLFRSEDNEEKQKTEDE
ncbi:MAG: phosphotyrosine protein phosphatase [Clostridiales bacterium]|nr:phosphotyrosine protein phosphatase [Clostridiales bacterium]